MHVTIFKIKENVCNHFTKLWESHCRFFLYLLIAIHEGLRYIHINNTTTSYKKLQNFVTYPLAQHMVDEVITWWNIFVYVNMFIFLKKNYNVDLRFLTKFSPYQLEGYFLLEDVTWSTRAYKIKGIKQNIKVYVL